MPFVKAEPMLDSWPKDCLRKPTSWTILTSQISMQRISSDILLAGSFDRFQRGIEFFFFFLSYNSMVNYTRIYRGISTSFKMFNKKSVYNNFWGTYTSERYFMQHPLSLPTYKYCFFGWLIFGRGSGGQGHVLMSWRAKSIHSGASICDRKCLFPQSTWQEKNDLGGWVGGGKRTAIKYSQEISQA